jgi:hypothetical protein
VVYHGIQHKLKYRIFFKVNEIFDEENKFWEFLGCTIRQTNFVTNEQGRATGECFVELEAQEDFDIAKSFNQKNLGSRMYY